MQTEHPTVYAVNGGVAYEGLLIGAYDAARGRILVVQSKAYSVLEHPLTDVFDSPLQAIERAKDVLREAIATTQRRLDRLEREGVDAILR